MEGADQRPAPDSGDHLVNDFWATVLGGMVGTVIGLAVSLVVLVLIFTTLLEVTTR